MGQREIWKWPWCLPPLSLCYGPKCSFWKALPISHVPHGRKSFLVTAGSRRKAYKSWMDIVVCCSLGSHLVTWLRKAAFWQNIALGNRERSFWKDNLWGSWGFGKTKSQQKPRCFHKILGGHTMLLAPTDVYIVLTWDLNTSPTYLNGPTSFYDMLVAIYNLLPAFKEKKEEMKTLQTWMTRIKYIYWELIRYSMLLCIFISHLVHTKNPGGRHDHSFFQ